MVSECECCVLVLEVCVCKLCLEREREMKQRERLTLAVFNVCTTVVLLVFLDGLFPCVFTSLVMCVGGVGVTLVRYWNWVVSGSECCVSCLGGVCLQVVLGEREREDEAERG